MAEEAIRVMPETASNEQAATPVEVAQGVLTAVSETYPKASGESNPKAGAGDVPTTGEAAGGCYLSVAEKSALSKPAQIMRELGLRRVVWFVLRGGTDEQREYLHTLIGHTVICRLPLSCARRQMIICRAYDAYTDMAHIRFYRAVLRQVFGEKCRISVRVAVHIPMSSIKSH